MSDCDVSVILPCLDEEGAVGGCIDEALTAIRAAGWSGEVVVVDNGSRDRSASVATARGARVVRESERGYGAALRAGFGVARGEVVVMADADHTYDLSRLAELVEPVRRGEADLVLGRRWNEGGLPMPVLHRYLGTPVLNRMVAAAGACAVADSQSGYRAMRRDAVLGLGLQSTGMELASEMLVLAGRQGWRVSEAPLPYRDRVGESKLVTWRDGARHIRELTRLAPQVLLQWVGAVAASTGAVITAAALLAPDGIAIGSLRWQPVFFASILLVLGVQAWVAGAVLRDRAEHRRLGGGYRTAGLVTLGGGLALDGALFLRWIGGTPSAAVVLPVAGFAQSLLLIGGSLLVLATIASLVQPAVIERPEDRWN